MFRYCSLLGYKRAYDRGRSVEGRFALTAAHVMFAHQQYYDRDGFLPGPAPPPPVNPILPLLYLQDLALQIGDSVTALIRQMAPGSCCCCGDGYLGVWLRQCRRHATPVRRSRAGGMQSSTLADRIRSSLPICLLHTL